MGVPVFSSPIVRSLLLHATLFALWAVALQQRATDVQPKRFTFVEVEPLKDFQKQRENDRSKRIVQTKPGERTETAPDNAFLGAQNQRVDRETVSKQRETKTGRGQNPKTAQAVPRSGTDVKAPPKMGDLSKLGVPILPQTKTPGAKVERQPDSPNWATTEGMPQDYVKGLKESETTALNTKEYVFYGYFQRIRERLDLAWGGTLRDQLGKIWRTGRRLASDMDHVTRVLVTLNAAGEIVRVQVVEESGTRDLDDAAVKAFNQAGPFPNPPKGIVDAQGLVQIRWDFVLKT